MGKKPQPQPRKAFAKAALAPKALIAKLRKHGLIIDDEEQAIQYLSFVGHFRLKGYWYQLQDSQTKKFSPGTTFSYICQRYECDREIRAVILEAVERIEVAVRSVIGNHLSLRYSPHWYLDFSIFAPTRSSGLAPILSKIEQEVSRANSRLYIDSYYKQHDEPYLPPSWAMTECMSIGLWSRLFKILKDPMDKKSVSSKFGIKQVEVFESWLHTLSILRNMAAHHDRFLGARIGVAPTNLKQRRIIFSDSKAPYASLTMINILLKSIDFGDSFKSRLMAIESTYGVEQFKLLGFPDDWHISGSGW